MNLYLRLILFFFLLPFVKKKRFTPTHISVLNLRVLPNDLDVFAHMNNGRYLTLMDFGRCHFMAQFGALKKAYQQGWSPVVGSVKITYIRALRVFSGYQLTTQLLGWDEKWIYMEQTFVHKKTQQLMATSVLKLLFLEKHKKVPSKELVEVFFPGENLESPPLPERVNAILSTKYT